MNIWILLIVALTVQEFASAGVVLTLAVNNHLPAWPIHLIWFAVTVGDMYLGYELGARLKERLRGTRFFAWTDKWLKKLVRRLGKYGEPIAIFILGTVDFPYLNTFLAAWLEFPRNASIALTLAGDGIWYAILWATVLGVKSITSNPFVIVAILVGLGIASHAFFRSWNKAQE